MEPNFTSARLGAGGPVVHRLGLSTTYRPGKKTVYEAVDAGVNVFFGFGIDTQMISVLRDVMRGQREKFVVVTGPYNLIWGHSNIRQTLESRLRALRTDYLDLFLLLGVLKPGEFSARTREELYRLREEGKVRGVGLSTHNRKLAGQLAGEGAVDAVMIRYNAAHRGAEQDIFPHLSTHNPGVISYTATRWRYLIRRPSSWAKDRPVPDAGMCYRFVLSNPHAHVCLTAPSNLKQSRENLASLQMGPLDEEEMTFIKSFGDVVHHTKKWFM